MLDTWNEASKSPIRVVGGCERANGHPMTWHDVDPGHGGRGPADDLHVLSSVPLSVCCGLRRPMPCAAGSSTLPIGGALALPFECI